MSHFRVGVCAHPELSSFMKWRLFVLFVQRSIYIFFFFNSSVYLKPSLFMDALASIQQRTGEHVGEL